MIDKQTFADKLWPLPGVSVKSLFHQIRKSKYVRNVAVVIGGTAAAQAINMGFAPVITRLYGPEAFGLMGIFISLLAIITPIAALTYPIAIVLPKDDNDAKGIVKLSSYFALAVSTVIAFVLIIGGKQLLSLVGAEAIESFIFLIPVAVLFAAFAQIAQQWLIRKNKFSTTARVTVLQTLIVNSAKAVFGWFQPFGSVLIALTTVGQTLHAVMLAVGAKRAGGPKASPAPEVLQYQTRLSELAKQYRNFPLFRAPQALLNALSHSFPVLLLASFSGPAAAGFYSLARTVMALPSTLISASIGNVLYPRIAEAANKGDKIAPMIIKATLVLALIGIIPFGILAAFGPWLFGFVFGSEWISAGVYAQWLTLWLFVAFINVPSVQALPVLSLLPFFLIFEIVSIILRISVLLLGFYFFASDIAAIALFSVIGTLLNIALIGVAVTKARHIDNFVLQRAR